VTLNKDVKWPEDCPRIRKLAKFFQEELSRIGLKPFMDEDAFMNHFYSPKVNENLNVTSIGFYLNKDYPDGMWVNHTL